MYAKLNPRALGWSLGLLWTFSTLVFHVLSFYYKDSTHMQNMLSLFSMAPEFSGMQILIACLWGLLYGFIVGFLLACMYNFMCKCCSCTSSCDENTCTDLSTKNKMKSYTSNLMQSVSAKSKPTASVKKVSAKPAAKKPATKSAKPAVKSTAVSASSDKSKK